MQGIITGDRCDNLKDQTSILNIVQPFIKTQKETLIIVKDISKVCRGLKPCLH